MHTYIQAQSNIPLWVLILSEHLFFPFVSSTGCSCLVQCRSNEDGQTKTPGGKSRIMPMFYLFIHHTLANPNVLISFLMPVLSSYVTSLFFSPPWWMFHTNQAGYARFDLCDRAGVRLLNQWPHTPQTSISLTVGKRFVLNSNCGTQLCNTERVERQGFRNWYKNHKIITSTAPMLESSEQAKHPWC